MPWIKQHQLNEIRLRVLDLENLGYQDDTWVLASRVAQVFYMPDPQSNLPPKKKTKHMVAYNFCLLLFGANCVLEERLLLNDGKGMK